MFEEIEEKVLRNKKKKPPIQKMMLESLPIVYNAINPPTTSMATDTRIQMQQSREEMQKWARENQDKIGQQRMLFNAMLERVQSISNRINKVIKGKKK